MVANPVQLLTSPRHPLPDSSLHLMETKILELAAAETVIDPAPRHVALIVHEIGGWAASDYLPRLEAHVRGIEALRGAVRGAIESGISVLSIHFSWAENAPQSLSPEQEESLFAVLHDFIHNDILGAPRNNVRLRLLGAWGRLAPVKQLQELGQLSQGDSQLTLVIAFNHGAREEMTDAVRALAEQVAQKALSPEEIDAALIAVHLENVGIPDPDLIILTSGQQRLSNVLLWQAAYAEFLFLPIHWRDFDKAAFVGAITEYAGRDRRYGRLPSRSNKKTFPV